MSKRFKRGFTLIELLVVIAIIGILASVVLVSLQSARKKGNDSRIISSVQQIRTEVEASYDGTINAYPTITSSSASYRLARRPTTGNIDILLDDIEAQQNSGGLTALYGASSINGSNSLAVGGTYLITKDTTSATSAKGYAIYARLPGSGQTFCLDGTGQSKYTTFPTAVPSATNAIACQ